ncbi:MAG: BON domain-containing protein [Vicinamibacterales bacterium]
MKKHIALVVAGLVFCAHSVMAQPAERKDLRVFNDISTTVNHYSFFTIFDDVSVHVNDGVVTLEGKVTMPYKKNDIEKRVAKVDGVSKVVNKIEVLPASTWDDRAAVPYRAHHLRQCELLELRRVGQPADPHHRGPRSRHADGRGAERRRAHAGAIAGQSGWCVLGDQQAADSRGGA